MSRIGKKIINIPEGVQVTINSNNVLVKGKDSEQTITFPEAIEVSLDNGIITVARKNEDRKVRMIHGTVRSNIANAIKGSTEGYRIELELQGVGYRVTLEGKNLSLSIGFKHLVKYPIPDTVKVEVPSQTSIIISGRNKEVVGQYAASVRALKPPEPYKGKGIRYLGEIVKKKEVKTVTA